MRSATGHVRVTPPSLQLKQISAHSNDPEPAGRTFRCRCLCPHLVEAGHDVGVGARSRHGAQEVLVVLLGIGVIVANERRTILLVHAETKQTHDSSSNRQRERSQPPFVCDMRVSLRALPFTCDVAVRSTPNGCGWCRGRDGVSHPPKPPAAVSIACAHCHSYVISGWLNMMRWPCSRGREGRRNKGEGRKEDGQRRRTANEQQQQPAARPRSALSARFHRSPSPFPVVLLCCCLAW